MFVLTKLFITQNEDKRMKKMMYLIAALVIFIQINGCTDKKTDAKSMEQLYSENGVPVKVQTISEKPITFAQNFNAVLTGYKESNASSMLADKVETIHFQVGDKVEKDNVVISFPTDSPGAKYYQVKVAYQHAETTLKRMKTLYESGGISLQEYENTKTQYEVSKANWDAVSQSVNVLAPISGVISRMDVQETENVQAGDKLFTVSQTQKLKAKLWIAENQIGSFHKGNTASATWNGIELSGNVVQVDMSMNSQNQAFGVVVEFSNPDLKVKSGVNAQVSIYSAKGKNGVVIDGKDIVQQDDKYLVYIIEGETAQAREIKTGKLLGLDVEITSGLNPGDIMITEGQLLLKNGSKIKIIN